MVIGFYKETEEYGCFSNWYPVKFKVDGIEFISSEQYMMFSKARLFGDTVTAAKILQATDQMTIKKLGREVTPFDGSLWNSRDMEIMKKGLLAKFSQNEDIKEILLSTGDNILAECAPRDLKWGIGYSVGSPAVQDPSKWRGQNKLGQVLMNIRDELRQSV